MKCSDDVDDLECNNDDDDDDDVNHKSTYMCISLHSHWFEGVFHKAI